MKSLLEFMYTGGTRVREERIELFLEAAKTLDVRVLCGEEYDKAKLIDCRASHTNYLHTTDRPPDSRMENDKAQDFHVTNRNRRDDSIDNRTVPMVPWLQPWMTPARCQPYSRTSSYLPSSQHNLASFLPPQFNSSTPPPARSAPLPTKSYGLSATPPPPRSAPPTTSACLFSTVPPSRNVPSLLPLKPRPGGIVTPCPWAQHGLPPLGLPPRRLQKKMVTLYFFH